MNNINKKYNVHTNIVYQGRVGYRRQHIENALAQKADLVCFTDDHPNETMTIPEFLIERRRLYSKVVRDRTGWEGLLDYFWWKSDQEKNKQNDDKKQLRLI